MILRSTIAIAVLALASVPAHSAVVASTNFDAHSLPSSNTAGNLNWTLGGVDDPGDMSAFNAGGDPQALFNGNATVQNIFAPGLNVGNGNTFWTTEVSLTVAAGFSVELTDVTLDYWAINGGQAQNVNRRSDFTITLTDPSATVVEAVTIADTVNGTGVANGSGTPITFPFSSALALSEPGTYTLEIKGGDFVAPDETGNHAAIDNLSINGNVTVIPEPSVFLLGGLGLCAFLRRRRS